MSLQLAFEPFEVDVFVVRHFEKNTATFSGSFRSHSQGNLCTQTLESFQAKSSVLESAFENLNVLSSVFQALVSSEASNNPTNLQRNETAWGMVTGSWNVQVEVLRLRKH